MIRAALSAARTLRACWAAISGLIGMSTPEFVVMLVATAPGKTTVTRTFGARAARSAGPRCTSLTAAFEAP